MSTIAASTVVNLVLIAGASLSSDIALILTAAFSVAWSYVALSYTWRSHDGGGVYHTVPVGIIPTAVEVPVSVALSPSLDSSLDVDTEDDSRGFDSRRRSSCAAAMGMAAAAVEPPLCSDLTQSTRADLVDRSGTATAQAPNALSAELQPLPHSENG